jgi:hypothetical protein
MGDLLRRTLARTLTLSAALLLCACEQPPDKELAAAEKQVEQARKAGAEQYAPARLHEAEAAMEDAHRKITEKDYRGALSSASDAADKARGAAKAASAAQALTRGAAGLAQAEARIALDEAAKVRAEAIRAKVPEAAFEELDPRAQKLTQDLEAAAATLKQGELIEAQRVSASIKTEATALSAKYRGAVDAWQAAHPKGRARVPAKPAPARPAARPPARKR